MNPTPTQEPASIADLPSEILLKTFSFLAPAFRDLVAASEVCRHWNALIRDEDLLWRDLCDAFHVDVASQGAEDELDSSPDPEAIHRAAFAGFVASHRDYLDVYPQQKALFKRLRSFLILNSPQTWAHFRGPLHVSRLATTQPTAQLLSANSGPDARALAIWYTFADGQQLPQATEEVPGDHGLFGTFTAYDEIVSIRMLPAAVVKLLPLNSKPGVVIAFFALCVQSGKHLAMVVSTPRELDTLRGHVVEVEFDSPRFVDHGPFREFIANYVNCLEAGERSIDSSGRISMFPELGPGTSTATTLGIKVEVSSLCTLEHRNPSGQFAYRVRLSWADGCPYPSAQLESRKWRIRYRSGAEETVEGRAVVGLYPLLSGSPGQQGMEYCSFCTGRQTRRSEALPPVQEGEDPFPGQDPPVWMEGSFVFVPGSLRNPIPGEQKFEVEVGRWYFQHPSYMV